MNYDIHKDLDKILKKLVKKDGSQYENIMKKIRQIIQSDDLNHFKNLKKPMQNYKRVHITGQFVLLFKVEKNTIIFKHYGHRDMIYRK